MGPTDFNAGSFRRNATASWQLALLACTSIALSIASGWTTWDGMENFTNNKRLGVLISFGVQGVMLIAAWLIGESLIGAGRDLPGSGQIRLNTPSMFGVLVGIAVTLTLVAVVADSIFPFFDGSAIARLL